jgi:hypothetical protein
MTMLPALNVIGMRDGSERAARAARRPGRRVLVGDRL